MPPEKNEVAIYFFSSKLELPEPLKYLDLAAKQYGFVPALEHEFEDINLVAISKSQAANAGLTK